MIPAHDEVYSIYNLSVTSGRSGVFFGYFGVLHQYNLSPWYKGKIVKSGVKHHKHSPNPKSEIRTAHSIEQGNQNRHENITKNHISYYITNLIKSRSHILSPFCFGSWRSNTSSLQLKGPSWSLSHGSLIYNYLCNQCLSHLKLWVLSPIQHYEIKLVSESWKWH